jgi:hypothetical protein
MEVKLQAYKGLIRPVLEYASTAYKKNWKKFRKGLLDLLHQTTTMNQAV